MITYLLQLTLCWILFYAAYHFLLSKETHFSHNRWYLLTALGLGLVLPLISWGSFLVHEPESLGHLYIAPLNSQMAEWDGVIYGTAPDTVSWYSLILVVYGAGVLITALQLIRSWGKILHIRRQSEIFDHKDYSLVLTDQAIMPFSFLGTVYCSRDFYRTSSDIDKILAHEEYHIHANHSLDVIFLEVLKVIFWFHPVVYVYKNELQQIHEYQADDAACRVSTKKQYGRLLLKHVPSSMASPLANHFFNSQLKNRFKMMTKKPSTRKTTLKYLIMLPLMGLTVLLFSYTSQGKTLLTTALMQQDTLMPPPPAPPVPSIGDEVYLDNSRYKIESSDILYVNGERIGPVTDELIEKYSAQGPWILHMYKGADARNKFGNDIKTGVYSIRIYTSKSTLWVGQPFTTQKGQVLVIEPTDVLLVNGDRKGFATQENLDKYVGANRWTFRVYKGSQAREKYDINDGTGVLDVELLKPSDKKPLIDKEMKENARTEGEIFRVVEEMPRFPGCEEMEGTPKEIKSCADRKMLEFLYTNIRYPATARDNGVEGNVVLSFVIEKDGSITNPKVVRDPGAGLGEEAVRVVEMMTELPEKWTPGVQKGRNVRVQFILPVKFELKSNKEDEQKAAARPLFVLDDEILGTVDINELEESIKPEDIESVNVLKGEKAIEKYGEKGRDGVVEITTKWRNTNKSMQLEVANVRIYPVPAQSLLNVEGVVTQDGSYRLEIRDLKGATIREQKINVQDGLIKTQLDVNGLATGPYFMVILHSGKVFSKAFVKQ